MTLQEKTLFRGKRVVDGEWVKGNYVNCYRPGLSNATGHFIVEYPGKYYDEIYTATVGRYTGLNDRNDTPIFEGDILQARLDDRYPDSVTTCVVEWQTEPHIGWFIRQVGRACKPDPLDKYDGKYWEVVGNIHDNPEMMEP